MSGVHAVVCECACVGVRGFVLVCSGVCGGTWVCKGVTGMHEYLWDKLSEYLLYWRLES